MWRILLLHGLLIASCHSKHHSVQTLMHSSQDDLPRVFIQPLGDADTVYTSYLKTHIAQFYKTEVIILQQTALPQNAFYRPRNRYLADSLLLFLKASSHHKDEYVLGVTNRDISTQKAGIANWGVMGLGFQPGNACIISSFRIKNKLRNKQQLLERLLKVGLHELGHNFGLQHCPNQHCIMVDAEGKNKLDGEEGMCKNCASLLQKKGIL